MTTEINAGFIPLLDAAIPIIAVERGFCEEEGIRLRLHKETSWANIRDRLTISHFDAAHLLAPMPIAAALIKDPMYPDVIVPMALGLGGNAVTVSMALWDAMLSHGARETGDASINGQALRRVCEARRAGRQSPLKLGVVHRFSSHNLELRYWLAASGIDPEADIEFVIVPPPFMADALRAGKLDGYCVGEPWNAHAVELGAGVIATTKSSIWRCSPEKVLAVRAAWADENPDALGGLIRAMAQASLWCAHADNAGVLAEILARDAYLGCRPDLVVRGLTGTMPFRKGGDAHRVDDFLLFADRAATFPWTSHALWFYSQLVRWKYVDHSAAAAAAVRKTYRPDIYRRSLQGTGIGIPNASLKVEGALTDSVGMPTTQGTLTLGPDGFFDGARFDPDLLDDYIRANRLPIN
jgi:NitT/TauT family transport system ATP-binding protein